MLYSFAALRSAPLFNQATKTPIAPAKSSKKAKPFQSIEKMRGDPFVKNGFSIQGWAFKTSGNPITLYKQCIFSYNSKKLKKYVSIYIIILIIWLNQRKREDLSKN